MAVHQEYRDEVVSSILTDEELTEKGKTLRIKNRYKARLLGSGTSSQTIQFIEKEIREEIHYERMRIQTAFKNLSFSKNEAAEHLAMGNISLMQEALGYALAEIANEITKSGNVSIPTRDEHDFHEARKLGREVNDVKSIHADQLHLANKFHDEAKSWGLFLWGGFLLLIVGTYVYMYSPLIMQAIHGIGQSGTEEAKRTENLISTVVKIFAFVFGLLGLCVIYQAGLKSLIYPIALVEWVFKWGSLRRSLVKTQSYNGEAKNQAFRALLWALSPSLLFLGLAGYYIFQPFAERTQSAKTTTVNNSFQPNALINLNRDNEPVRDAGNVNANILETLASNTPILVLRPTEKKRWYEVQTPSGKTGWIDGYGFRLASSAEIASYSPGASPANSNTVNSNVAAAEQVATNSDELATASPLPNPFGAITDQASASPPPPPIEDPELAYRETRQQLLGVFKVRLRWIIHHSNKFQGAEESTVANEFFRPLETPLRNVVFSIDANLLKELQTFIYRYEDSVGGKFSLLDSEMKFQTLKKYKVNGLEYSPRSAPERDIYADKGVEILKAKQTQMIEMLGKIASAAAGSPKQLLINQSLEQFNREKRELDKKQREMSVAQQEAGY